MQNVFLMDQVGLSSNDFCYYESKFSYQLHNIMAIEALCNCPSCFSELAGDKVCSIQGTDCTTTSNFSTVAHAGFFEMINSEEFVKLIFQMSHSMYHVNLGV